MKGSLAHTWEENSSHDVDTSSERSYFKEKNLEERVGHRIRAHMSHGTLIVTLTDNRYTMISVKRDKLQRAHYVVRLHHMFVGASVKVYQALAKYIAQNDSGASRFLGEYIDANQHNVKPGPKRQRTINLIPHGDHFDLDEIFIDLNEKYFAGKIKAKITWGQRSKKRRRRNSMKMGSYSLDDRIIRIHRSLDRDFVPRYFIEWVIYHEMLHEVHQAPVVNGRRQFHSAAFMRDEALYEHYALAKAWERAHVDELLTF